MKKIIIILTIFFSACIRCPDVLPHWNIANFDIRIYDFNYNPPANGLIQGDSLNLIIDYSIVYVESYFSNSFPFVNAAYAWSCDESGREGIKDPIVDVTVTSNADFNQFIAGESLNSIIRTNDGVNIEDWISGSQALDLRFLESNQLIITQKPLIEQVHEFTIRFEFQSGRILESNSEMILWN